VAEATVDEHREEQLSLREGTEREIGLKDIPIPPVPEEATEDEALEDEAEDMAEDPTEETDAETEEIDETAATEEAEMEVGAAVGMTAVDPVESDAVADEATEAAEDWAAVLEEGKKGRASAEE
jgi:hypothetical protein